MIKPKNVGTHSGVFHSDEVIATTMLVNFTNEFKNAKITRSRDKEVLKTMDILVDVGSEYIPETHRYDHHQKGFNETYSNDFQTKLSSAGLVFKHFKKEIIQNCIEYIFTKTDCIDQKFRVDLTDEQLEEFANRMYREFFEFIDANDNGIHQYPKETKLKFKTPSTDIIARVSRLNFGRFSEISLDQNAQFKKAMEIALEELVHEIQYIYIDNYICVPIIKKSIESRLSFHPSGKLFKLEKGCNWRASYGKIEESLGLKDQLLYVIFLDETDFTFRAVGIPETQGSFQVRKPFREDFRGTRDEELQNLTGTKTANFCHAGGFIAGAKTLEDIIKICELSMEENEKKE